MKFKMNNKDKKNQWKKKKNKRNKLSNRNNRKVDPLLKKNKQKF